MRVIKAIYKPRKRLEKSRILIREEQLVKPIVTNFDIYVAERGTKVYSRRRGR